MEFKEAIKTLPFYLIVLMISLSTLGANCVITFYKVIANILFKFKELNSFEFN